MNRLSRFFETAATPPPPSEEMLAAESVIMLLFSILLGCVTSLSILVCFVCFRRFTAGGDSPSSLPDEGLKRKAIQSLPRSTFTGDSTECAICLAYFAEGEAIRVLPLCDHFFHVTCIDKWLVSRSSCPSCRRILTPV